MGTMRTRQYAMGEGQRAMDACRATGATLATRNTGEFEATGIQLICQ